MGLRRGQVAVSKLVRINSAKDVRNLRHCPHCKKLGDQRRMIRGVLLNDFRTRKFVTGDYLHGRCVIKIGGIELLKLLPRNETFKLSLSDIGVDACKRLLDKSPALSPRKQPKKVSR
jgi:hypothetical protein